MSINIRAMLCIKCHEYIIIEPNNSDNIKSVNEFKYKHRKGIKSVIDFTEIQHNIDKYKEYKSD